MARKISVVEIPYEQLLDPSADLTEALWRGFGPDGLGIVTVSGVPDYPALRDALLPLAQQFADLPNDVKQAHEHAASSYNVGWSHGKEALRSGMPDTHKGSFYANPLQDTYDGVDQDTASRYRSYYSPNLWPRQALPQLEGCFKQLGSLVIDVGLLLAQHCSKYVQQQLSNAVGQPLSQQEQAQLDFEGQLRRSSCHKARLLHYFPTNCGDQQQQQQQVAAGEDWCGWHLDHGALTGLTSAMYIKDGQQVPCPDPSAGLYICDRSGEVVQAAIPPGHIAYQMGQVMAIQSGGLLRATPHCVRAAAAGEPGVSRNTFAVFMQPETSLLLEAPRAAAGLGALLCMDSGHWAPGMSFGEFAEATMHGYYATPAAAAAAASGSPARSAAAAAAAGSAGGADATPTSAKDVAPASVLMAAEAAVRKRLQLLVSHE
ncbi:hypothetical protein OEZ85_013004 [Tetradesmus obliquus]|uniref:Non-haem dioxygenase N-terminal domain-containing protein n=1 Tax=Tetradesmus obliquus TaxID=3088 RepID=A0ABY8U4C3_TETOB|nr:hypothetical protein OEZ85_013004 [Tetradesmus obliquus]